MSSSGLAFLLVYFGGLVASLVRNPLYGLGVYVLTFYAHPPARWWGRELPDLRWALMVSLVILVSVLIYKKKLLVPGRPSWIASPIMKLLVLYTLWMWIQSIWAVSPYDHAYGRMLYTKFIILMALMYLIINDDDKLQLFSFANVLGCFYLGWLAWESGKSGAGVGGPGIDTSNNLAAHLNVGVMFGAMLLLSPNKYIRMVAFIALPFILNGVILTGSRGGFLALMAGGVVLYILTPKNRKGRMKIYAVLGFVLFSALAGEQFIARINTIVPDEAGQQDNSAESRFYIAAVQWKIFKSNLWGTGHRGTKTLSYQYLDSRFLDGGSRSSHNFYLTVLVDQGVPGGVIYFLLIITAAKLILSLKKRLEALGNEKLSLLNAATGASLVCLAISGMFSSVWRMEILFWCFSTLMILSSLVILHERRAAESEQPLVK